MVNAHLIYLWIHVVSMVGVLGGLLLLQLGLPRDLRANADLVKSALRPLNILLGIGFVAGLLLYMNRMDGATGHVHGVVGMKILILVAVGALLPISRKSVKGDGLRWTAIGLLLLASFSGFTV